MAAEPETFAVRRHEGASARARQSGRRATIRLILKIGRGRYASLDIRPGLAASLRKVIGESLSDLGRDPDDLTSDEDGGEQ
ncbi:hypothetical protein [Chelatococcus sp. XZ-Ab1]|uniref:hypothetical protein n=1 Tax=Chelatococcus sp. XZ-Ab1 TaxID=3034027 RepID=UPI0023E383F3|nr:hypothetical protein [Chelatococcus sp. XZ-Ab1]